MSFGHPTGKFECRDRLLSADRGNTVQKFVERISGFEVVVKGFHWNPRSHEDLCPAENLRIAMDDQRSIWRGSLPVFSSIRPAVAVVRLTPGISCGA
jgi:hypothetical protein